MGLAGPQDTHGLKLFETEGLPFELLEVANVKYRVVDTVYVLEAAVRQATIKGHLPAFEAWTMAAARACFHPLVASTRGLAVTSTPAAAEDFMAVSGALDFGQCVEFHIGRFRLSAEGFNLFESPEFGKAVERGLHNGLRVIGTQRLGEDILVASHFQDSADTATSNETGTRGSRTEHDDAAISMADHFMRDSITAKIDMHEGTVGSISALTNRIRNFLGLTVADSDATLAITRYDQRSKVETTATFDDL